MNATCKSALYKTGTCHSVIIARGKDFVLQRRRINIQSRKRMYKSPVVPIYSAENVLAPDHSHSRPLMAITTWLLAPPAATL